MAEATGVDLALDIQMLNRISGPLLDRIDLHLEACSEGPDLSSTESAKPSAAIRSRLIESHRIQGERFA